MQVYTMVKAHLKKTLREWVERTCISEETVFRYMSFSQEGEDGILRRIFESQTTGFYVDIGAHHPQRFSNTYHFYLQGWHGINVDAMPDSMKKFNAVRPRDINLEIAVSDVPQELTYYIFEETALNGFNAELAAVRQQVSRLVSKKEIITQTLAGILNQYLPPNQNIDFLNVDVEGLDLQVLKSNDWNKYRPRVVLAEDLSNLPLQQAHRSETVCFLLEQNYTLFCQTPNTLFFRDSN